MSKTTTAVRITIATLVVAGGVLALVNAGSSSDRSSSRTAVAPAIGISAPVANAPSAQGSTDRTGERHSSDSRGSGSSVGSAGPGVAMEIYIEGHDPTDGRPVSANQNWETYLYSILVDVDTFWVGQFASWGYPEPQVTYAFPVAGQEASTACTTPIGPSTMQYCPTDDILTIHQDAAAQLANGVSSTGLQNRGAIGDMGIAVIVAHEYGHNLWNELELFDNSTNAQLERGADCFAGVWAADAQARGILEDGDLDEAYAALDLVAEHPDLGVSDNGVHGTPQERQEAFTTGFTDGAAACTQAYSNLWG